MTGSSTKSLRMRQAAQQQECTNRDGATMQIYKTAKRAETVARIKDKHEQTQQQQGVDQRAGAARAPE